MKCEISKLCDLTNLVSVHKFNKYGIGRLKLMCKYQYFSYIIRKHSSFFSWTLLIIQCQVCHWVIRLFTDSDLENIFHYSHGDLFIAKKIYKNARLKNRLIETLQNTETYKLLHGFLIRNIYWKLIERSVVDDPKENKSREQSMNRA